MLCISMKIGDYFTVGGNTVIQFDHLSGERIHLNIDAPREIAILRGEVLERNGGQRPNCIFEKPPQYVRQLPWNRAKKQALAELRQTLDQMDDSPEIQFLRKKLDYIFPQNFGADKPASP